MLAYFASLIITLILYIATTFFFQTRLEKRGMVKVLRDFASSMESIGFVHCVFFLMCNSLLSAVFVAAGATPLAGGEGSVVNESTALPIVCVMFAVFGVWIFISYRNALSNAEAVVKDYDSRK